eukprot:scaffold94414_cov69-Phaeocystis_antarctica.AAC.10
MQGGACELRAGAAYAYTCMHVQPARAPGWPTDLKPAWPRARRRRLHLHPRAAAGLDCPRQLLRAGRGARRGLLLPRQRLARLRHHRQRGRRERQRFEQPPAPCHSRSALGIRATTLCMPTTAQTSPAGAPCVYLQGCCGDPAVDIAVSGLWCRGVGAPRNGCAAENCTIDEATLHVVTGAWPEAAQAIVDAAGATAPR